MAGAEGGCVEWWMDDLAEKMMGDHLSHLIQCRGWKTGKGKKEVTDWREGGSRLLAERDIFYQVHHYIQVLINQEEIVPLEEGGRGRYYVVVFMY
jgi:hypothetical protein